MKTIKKKSEESELIVQEMCKDIKTLDLAKKNITLSINCLRKYADLITSLENLKSNFQNKNYKNSSENMKTIIQLAKFFKPYEGISQVETTLRDKNKILSSLKLQLKDEFILFFKNFSDMSPAKLYQGMFNFQPACWWKPLARNSKRKSS